jgi:PKD repeat protein
MSVNNIGLSVFIGLLIIGLMCTSLIVDADEILLINEDFEDTSGWGNPGTGFQPLPEWSSSHPSGYFWMDGSLFGQDAHSGSKAAYSYTASDSMISPEVTLLDGSSTLTFWYRAETSTAKQSLAVYVKQAETSTKVWDHVDFTHESWEEATISLNSFALQTIEIEFVNIGDPDFDGVLIDTVVLRSEGNETTSSDDDSIDPGSGSSGSSGGPPITDNHPPVADFSVSQTVTFVNAEIVFNASLSSDSDGDSLDFNWDFGDSHTSTGMIVTHSYTTAGVYDVVLLVDDGNGGTDTVSHEIVINSLGNLPPEIPRVKTSLWVTDLESFEINKIYTYTIASTDPDNDSIRFSVEWGDGTINDTGLIEQDASKLSKVDVSHQWDDAGIYLLTIRAIDEKNASSELKRITVFVDVDVLFIDDEIVGYLVDFHRNDTITHFYNNETKEYTSVQQVDPTGPDEDFVQYLIDITGDGTYDYTFSLRNGLDRYLGSEKSVDAGSEETPGFELMLSLIAISIFFIICRKRKLRV